MSNTHTDRRRDESRIAGTAEAKSVVEFSLFLWVALRCVACGRHSTLHWDFLSSWTKPYSYLDFLVACPAALAEKRVAESITPLNSHSTSTVRRASRRNPCSLLFDWLQSDREPSRRIDLAATFAGRSSNITFFFYVYRGCELMSTDGPDILSECIGHVKPPFQVKSVSPPAMEDPCSSTAPQVRNAVYVSVSGK